MHRTKVLAVLLAGLLLGVPLCTQAQQSLTRAVATNATYAAGSAEVRDIRSWLLRNAEYHNGAMIGDPDRLGAVRVTYTAVASAVQSLASPGDQPPVPLPATGNPGDTMSITSSSRGYTQTWTYQRVGSSTSGSWSLIEYRFFQDRPT